VSPRPLTVIGFSGMNTTHRARRFLTNQDGVALPALVLNAHVSNDGVLIRRDGQERIVVLSGAKCLWAGSVALCIAEGSLYRISGNAAIKLCDIEGTTMAYAEAAGSVYLSNDKWCGVYDVGAGTVRAWGLPRPPAPKLTLVAGDLPPGTYHVCNTYLRDGRLGGASAATRIAFAGSGMGISLSPASDALTWITEPNTDRFFLAESVPITTPAFGMPLPTKDVTAPPFMSSLAAAHGRIWGTCGTKLYYSEPFQYEWFKDANTFDIGEVALDLVTHRNQIYIRTEPWTYILRGTEPAKMDFERLCTGGVGGRMFTGMVTEEGRSMVVPFWLGRDGLFRGGAEELPVNISSRRIADLSGDSWCGLVIDTEGLRRVLLTVATSKETEFSALAAQNRLGTMHQQFVASPYSRVGSGGLFIT